MNLIKLILNFLILFINVISFSNTYAMLQGYIPLLNNGPNDCCKHTSQWDDSFTLMCQTCAYDVFGKKETVLLPFTLETVPTVDLILARIIVDPPAGVF